MTLKLSTESPLSQSNGCQRGVFYSQISQSYYWIMCNFIWSSDCFYPLDFTHINAVFLSLFDPRPPFVQDNIWRPSNLSWYGPKIWCQICCAEFAEAPLVGPSPLVENHSTNTHLKNKLNTLSVWCSIHKLWQVLVYLHLHYPTQVRL